ncbi:hypothetical protein LTR86_007617 [Recurvomyces mirabilis]|nr:hypothetical protein LTR86_007617 [Recurvomyces mirabilis]
MADEVTCAHCTKIRDLKKCGRCKTVSYCSKDCQKAGWTTHKSTCRFSSDTEPSASNDAYALSFLRGMSDLTTKPDAGRPIKASVGKALNISELRLTIFGFLPASTLLRAQRVCRSWYHTIALDQKLQQRLFLAPGPGELVFPAKKGIQVLLAIQPRNDRQVEANQTEKRGTSETSTYLVTAASGSLDETTAAEIESKGEHIVLNPFFTSLWTQDPTNMTLSPSIKTLITSKTASWRRMQLTSPPVQSISMSVWYTKPNGRGNQLVPSTGKVPTGVTLGHLADLLAAQPKKLTMHWMQIHGYVWWSRSSDAVVVPKEGEGGNNESRPGVYVNPSNGIAFPGFV